MTPAEIRAAIAADAELQGLGPDAVAAALSVGYEPGVSQEVDAWRLHRYLVKRSRWRGIVAAAANDQHPATVAAQAAVDLATGPTGMRIDLADGAAETAAMLAGLVLSGLITAEQRDEMVSWCKVPRVVTARQVVDAIQGA